MENRSRLAGEVSPSTHIHRVVLLVVFPGLLHELVYALMLQGNLRVSQQDDSQATRTWAGGGYR